MEPKFEPELGLDSALAGFPVVKPGDSWPRLDPVGFDSGLGADGWATGVGAVGIPATADVSGTGGFHSGSGSESRSRLLSAASAGLGGRSIPATA